MIIMIFGFWGFAVLFSGFGYMSVGLSVLLKFIGIGMTRSSLHKATRKPRR